MRELSPRLLECLSFDRLTKTGADTEPVELSYVAGGNAKRYCRLRKTVGWFLRNLNMHLPYHPAIPFLPIYSREMKMTQSLVGKCLFVMNKIWKKNTCSLIGKWIDIYIYNEIQLGMKERKVNLCNNMDESQNHCKRCHND